MDERTEPSDQLEWVSDFMREIRKDYLLWDKEYGGAHEIVFAEGEYIVDEGEDTEETVPYQEVCFWNGEQLESVNDDHVYPKYDDAYRAFEAISQNIPHDKEGIKVLAFRHGDNDWSSACTIEPSVVVNKLGWAVFVRRDLLENSNMIIHKYTDDEP